MQIIINSYVTAVDENDPEKGNHQVYAVTREGVDGAENTPNLSEEEVLKLVEQYLSQKEEE